MTTIIISDTHLTKKFEQKKFSYFKKIIEPTDQVIINGDFWDKYFSSFDQFINSEWSQLFPLLKKKQAIYIFGNHDQKDWCNDKTSLFSIKQTYSHQLPVGQYELHIEHGNRIAPDLEGQHPWIPANIATGLIGLSYEIFGLKIYGDKFLVKAYKHFNKKMKSWAKSNLKNQQILVCGHSHLREYDPKNKFINTGFIRYGYGQYLKINDDELFLVDEKY